MVLIRKSIRSALFMLGTLIWAALNPLEPNDISEQVMAAREEIADPKNSPEDIYEKQYEIPAEKIAEIDKRLEKRENDAETIIFAKELPETEPSKDRLPTGVDTNRYDCEHYSFGVGSDQYYLQLECLTDENGLRYFYHNDKKYYCVAMGGAYGIDIGDTWNVTLECGTKFGVILSDYQHPITFVDPNDFGEYCVNYDGELTCHVLEFVVDMEAIPGCVMLAGTVSALEEFGGLFGDGGNIIDISYNGRLWQRSGLKGAVS